MSDPQSTSPTSGGFERVDIATDSKSPNAGEEYVVLTSPHNSSPSSSPELVSYPASTEPIETEPLPSQSATQAHAPTPEIKEEPNPPASDTAPPTRSRQVSVPRHTPLSPPPATRAPHINTHSHSGEWLPVSSPRSPARPVSPRGVSSPAPSRRRPGISRTNSGSPKLSSPRRYRPSMDSFGSLDHSAIVDDDAVAAVNQDIITRARTNNQSIIATSAAAAALPPMQHRPAAAISPSSPSSKAVHYDSSLFAPIQPLSLESKQAPPSAGPMHHTSSAESELADSFHPLSSSATALQHSESPSAPITLTLSSAPSGADQHPALSNSPTAKQNTAPITTAPPTPKIKRNMTRQFTMSQTQQLAAEDEGADDVTSGAPLDWKACYDFSCGLRLRCGLDAEEYQHNWTYHASAIVTLLLLGGLSALLFLVPGSEALRFLNNSAFNWFFSVFLLCCLIYVTMQLQEIAHWGVEQLLADKELFVLYFASKAIITSSAALITVSVTLAHWDTFLGFDDSTANFIHNLIVALLLLVLLDMFRKYVTQLVIMRFNEKTYRQRIDDLKFRETSIAAVLHNQPLEVLAAASADGKTTAASDGSAQGTTTTTTDGKEANQDNTEAASQQAPIIQIHTDSAAAPSAPEHIVTITSPNTGPASPAAAHIRQVSMMQNKLNQLMSYFANYNPDHTLSPTTTGATPTIAEGDEEKTVAIREESDSVRPGSGDRARGLADLFADLRDSDAHGRDSASSVSNALTVPPTAERSPLPSSTGTTAASSPVTTASKKEPATTAAAAGSTQDGKKKKKKKKVPKLNVDGDDDASHHGSQSNLKHETSSHGFQLPKRRTRLEMKCYRNQALIFANLDKENKGYLVLNDFTGLFASTEDTVKAFKLFKSSDTKAHVDAAGQPEERATRKSTREALRAFYSDRENLAKSLTNFSNVTVVLRALINIVYGLVGVIFVLYAFQYNLNSMLVTFGTIIAAISFALSETIKNVVNCMIFLLITRPYDVGDRIQLGFFQGNGPGKQWIHAVSLMTTTFRSTYGKIMIMPNYVLADMAITNLKRSPNAIWTTNVQFHYSTPPQKLEQLLEQIGVFLRSGKSGWKDNFDCYATNLKQSNSLELTLWFTHNVDHSQSGVMWKDINLLLNQIRVIVHQLGIEWRNVPQPVEFTEQVEGREDSAPSATGASSSVPSASTTAASLSVPAPSSASGVLRRRRVVYSGGQGDGDGGD